MDQEPEVNDCPIATTAPALDIKPINKDTVHRICSGQVVLNLGVAVKELVENSIDAGATLVEVRFKDQGLEMVEVVDNGCGVQESNFEGLTAKYHTSKIREFTDLAEVSTFGFRGEALSSLCALSDMVVTTRHVDATCATRLELDHRGVIQKRTPCARSRGTTITLTNLFATLPVRKREFVKNVRKEFTRMCQIMQGYCLIAKGVRIICTNTSKKGAKSTLMATNGTQSYAENITAIFGPKQQASLLELTMNKATESTAFQVEGWISSCAHGSGRSGRDRQFFYVNSRPCEPKQVIRVINETYHKYNTNQSPFVFLNVIIASQQVDVNVTPDKRQILVNNENILLEFLKDTLLQTFGAIPSTFSLQNVDVTQHSDSPNQSFQNSSDEDTMGGDDTLKPNPKKFFNMLSQWRTTGQTSEPAASPGLSKKRKSESNEISSRNVRMKSIHEFLTQLPEKEIMVEDEKLKKKDLENTQDDADVDEEFRTECDVKVNPEENHLQIFKIDPSEKLEDRVLQTVKVNSYFSPSKANTAIPNKSPKTTIKDEKSSRPSTSKLKDFDLEIEPEEACLDFKNTSISTPMAPTIHTSIAHIKQLMEREKNATTLHNQVKKKSLERLRFKATIDPSKNKVAEKELQTEIQKSDFRRMDIIGQFNLGFIVTRLDDDLFIIDQHASDEKYNFETLQQTTRLQNQPLMHPQHLDLTAVNEMVLIDNREVFEMNGFKFNIDEEAETTKKCRLIGKPFSKNWEFGKEDIDELLFMLHDSPHVVCRPSRIRAMFASRACRKSVMIGTALSVTKMRQLVDQISEIDHPWNCPHGRPTMRHLINIAMLEEVPATPLDATLSTTTEISSTLLSTSIE